jgi:acyl-CoA reductase-like NAD-dependent aldehyde dehydrogenase
LMQGVISEDIAPGIDEIMLRQPVGVCASISPFNFPGMIPFWFMPYALACGNTVIVKPSERVPLTMQRLFQILEAADLPKGVLNLVNGSKDAVDALLDHPAVRAVSFVGSTAVARYIYSRAAANGKRAQCQGGAKNPIVILPDADLETSTRIIADSAFGCAGGAVIPGYERGNFLRPTVLSDLPLNSEVASTEIFGPVFSLLHVDTVEEAIALVNRGKYGNMACLFTSSGSAARKFRNETDAGNIGINIGVAAPIAYFPFSGWKESFFGDLHGQAADAVDFFTQKKVVVERWPKEWSRKF